jgi:hypothetical protein
LDGKPNARIALRQRRQPLQRELVADIATRHLEVGERFTA